LTPRRFKTPKPIAKKIVLGDYVGEATRCAKFGRDRFMGVFWGGVRFLTMLSNVAEKLSVIDKMLPFNGIHTQWQQHCSQTKHRSLLERYEVLIRYAARWPTTGRVNLLIAAS